eukprot:m.58078 g.58078  ORF g.58078 m.58078 type:complete len:67 (+) comp11653_c0_seq4:37-237(+)
MAKQMQTFLQRARVAGNNLHPTASSILSFWFGDHPHWPAGPDSTVGRAWFVPGGATWIMQMAANAP